MKRQEIAKRKEWDEKEAKRVFGNMGYFVWPLIVLFSICIIVFLSSMGEGVFQTTLNIGSAVGALLSGFFGLILMAGALQDKSSKKRWAQEEAERTDVSKDTLEGDIYLIAKEELRIAEIELAAARQGQEPDPEATKLNIPFAGQIPKLCKNCAYAKDAEFSDGDLVCQKRTPKVGRNNVCNYFEDRRVTTAYMEAKKAFNKFKELDESGFH